MRIAAVYCVYNEDEYIEYSIRSIEHFVDRIFVLLGQAPYAAYNKDARAQFRTSDRTEEIVRRLAARQPKLRLIPGVWDSELEHRNAGMRLCWEDGADYYFLVDGDEVYRRDHLERLREDIAAHPEAGQFIIKCDLFWRSFGYRIPADDMPWMPRRVFKMTRWSELGKSHIPIPRRSRFTGNNKTDSLGSVFHCDTRRVIFYHFSFARSPEKMREKLLTYSHAHEILSGWYERVWLRWPAQRDMRDLNPVDPPKLPQALARPVDDLPEVMREHPYYAQEIIGNGAC